MKIITDEGKVKEGEVSDLRTGTSRMGEMEISFDKIVKVFGQPNHPTDGDDKVQAEWLISTPVGIATIYNYKDGLNYISKKDGGLTDKQITDWHIGGNTSAVVYWVKKALNARPEVKEYKATISYKSNEEFQAGSEEEAQDMLEDFINQLDAGDFDITIKEIK